MKSETPLNSNEEPRDADTGAPRPIARALVAAFVAILLLVIASQGLATWNAGTLSRTITVYAAEEAAIRELTLALFEIENANSMLRDWLLTFEPARFDPSAYSLHVANAKDALDRIENLPARHQGVRDAIIAALEDLKTRTLLAYPAVHQENRQAATEIAMDRRAIASAYSRLGEGVHAHQAEIEDLRRAAARQARSLDLSLALITGAMIMIAMLLAFLWKKLIWLH